MSLFSARKFEYTSPEPKSLSSQSCDVELTRTNRYRVSKLRSFPSSVEGCQILGGSIDHSTGMSAAVTCDSVVVWKHTAQESIPITLSFEYEKNSYNIPPVVLFVPPVSESAKPGIVIIDAVSGSVTYYESLHTATVSGFVPANISSFSLQVGLSSEFIACAEYVDGLRGVLCSTSSRKVFLLRLKDAHGHPCLAKSELCSSKRSFLSAMFPSTSASYDYNLYLERAKICAMKQGLPRQILIQDSDGTLTVFEYQNGIIGTSIKTDLKQPLCSFLAEIYPHIYYTFQIKDIQLVSEDVYLVLADFEKDQRQRSLVIFKLKINSTGVLILSSHKVMSLYTDVRDQPRLYAKETEAGRTSIFVVASSSVLLMEVFENSANNWEDTVSTKTPVVVSVAEPEAAACLVMTNTGVLKVSATLAAAFPLSLVDRLKSHIEQAVLFGKEPSNPVDFNIDQRDLYSSVDISEAVNSICHETFYNTSSFLPQSVTLLESHLLKKSKVLLDLATFVGQNFKGRVDIDTQLQLVVMLEKLAISERLYCEIHEHELCKFAELCIEKIEPGCSMRDFFLGKLNRVGDLIKHLCTEMGDLKPAQQLLVKEIIASSLKQYYMVETNTRLGILGLEKYSASSVTPLFAETPDLVLSLNFHDSSLFFCKLAYYVTVDSLAWISVQPNTKQLQDARVNLQKFFNTESCSWIQVMAQDETKTEYLDMFEHFQDFESLVEFEISVSGAEMVNVLQYYLEKYQYPFARVLFKRLITHRKLELLVKGFPSYKQYLDIFFEEESQFARYAWLNDLVNNSDLLTAAAHLLKASKASDESVSQRTSHLSLAKLSLKVYENRLGVSQKNLLQVIEKQKMLVDLQKKVEGVISTFVTGPTVSKELCISMTSSTLLDRYDINDKEKLLTRLEKYIDTFSHGKSLSLLETVDLATLIDPHLTSSMENNFSDVFALLMQFDGNFSVNLWLQKYTWRKLLLVDDWKRIDSLSVTKSEKFVLDTIRNTAFYKTVKQLPHGFHPDFHQIMTPTSYQDLKGVLAELGEFSQVGEREMEEGLDCGLLEKLVNDAEVKKWVENIALHM